MKIFFRKSFSFLLGLSALLATFRTSDVFSKSKGGFISKAFKIVSIACVLPKVPETVLRIGGSLSAVVSFAKKVRNRSLTDTSTSKRSDVLNTQGGTDSSK